MSEDLIEKSKQVLANIDFNNTTYEIARDVVLDEIERLTENNQAMQEEMARTWEKNTKLQNIIKETIEYIKTRQNTLNEISITKILEILDKDSDKE